MSVDWYGSKPLRSFSAPLLVHPTTTQTVEELIVLLQAFPKDAPVGTCMTSIHGHVNGVQRVTQDEHGCVILDMTEECLYSDEVNMVKNGDQNGQH